MTSFERRIRLLNFLQDQPGIRVPDLAKLLDASEGTIRNDLRALEASGKLTRVWGGGVPLKERGVSATFDDRSQRNQPAKRSIAQQASRIVSDGDSILLDASTTVFQMASFLEERKNLTIATNGIDVARELAHNSSNTVILLGGILRSDGSAVTRLLHDQLLKDLHIKTAFISSSGFSFEAGLTEVDLYEAQFKRMMIASAGRVVALIDSTKFGKVDLTSCAWIEQVSHIYTDNGLSDDWRDKLKQTGVPFTVCCEAPEPESQS